MYEPHTVADHLDSFEHRWTIIDRPAQYGRVDKVKDVIGGMARSSDER